ncbi:MAG: FG-GAP-like repeat-containing protein [bacterium]
MSTLPSPLALVRYAKVISRVSLLVACFLFLLLIGTTATTRAQSFSTPTSYVIGSNPNSVSAGDFNGDSKPDLATANFQSDSVSVLINNGNGTFATAVNYPTDLHPQSVTTGDFNGDGKRDLAVGNFDGGTGTGNISILLGNGNGTFQSAVNFVALHPDSLIASDLNNDGKLDLLAANWTNGFSVLLGNGNGTFGVATTYPAGSQPQKIALADFNGDGKADVAAPSALDNTVNILLGNGDGTFQAPTGFSSPGANSVAAGDLNGDGNQDLVIAGSGMRVALGNGNGTFQTPVNYPGGDSPPVIGDFNGDGKLDVAMGDFYGGTVLVKRGNGDGTLQSPLTFPAKPNPANLTVSDLDADGKPDLAIASNGTGRANILLNSPSVHGVAINGVAGALLINVLVGTFFDYDATKTAGTFTATVDWGDPTVPTGATVSANGSGAFNVNGTHTYAKEGTYHFVVRIADMSGNFASATGTATVADAPLTATGKTISAVRGAAFTGVVANFIDADPTGNVAEFSANIGWGDGANSVGTISNDGSGGFNISGSHTYTSSGSFPIVVMIQDVGGSSATANGTANVSAPAIQFSLSNYSVNESGGSVQVTVARIGDTTGTASVDYATIDQGSPTSCATVNGKASTKCDFTTALGSLRFGAGEASKTFTVLIAQDNFVEGPETIGLTLSNVTGDGILGSPSTATLTINDDATEPPGNPIDDSGSFVRQHYRDFLNREADTSGLNFWTGEIENCTPKPQCTEIKRINVSAAFFLSIEFQETGYLVYRIYKSGFGNLSGKPVPVVLNNFLRDTQEIGRGVVVNATGWEQVLENNKQAYALSFVARPEFLAAYPNTLTADQVVTQLDTNAGGVLSAAEKANLVAVLGATPADVTKRASVLRSVAEDADLKSAEFNKAFVLMQYFGYLRRNPNDAPEPGLNFDGYNFWLNKLNQFNGNFINAEMVKAFIVSGEYRQRFGP